MMTVEETVAYLRRVLREQGSDPATMLNIMIRSAELTALLDHLEWMECEANDDRGVL